MSKCVTIRQELRTSLDDHRRREVFFCSRCPQFPGFQGFEVNRHFHKLKRLKKSSCRMAARSGVTMTEAVCLGYLHMPIMSHTITYIHEWQGLD